jgi:hypothetical protein
MRCRIDPASESADDDQLPLSQIAPKTLSDRAAVSCWSPGSNNSDAESTHNLGAAAYVQGKGRIGDLLQERRVLRIRAARDDAISLDTRGHLSLSFQLSSGQR